MIAHHKALQFSIPDGCGPTCAGTLSVVTSTRPTNRDSPSSSSLRTKVSKSVAPALEKQHNCPPRHPQVPETEGREVKCSLWPCASGSAIHDSPSSGCWVHTTRTVMLAKLTSAALAVGAVPPRACSSRNRRRNSSRKGRLKRGQFQNLNPRHPNPPGGSRCHSMTLHVQPTAAQVERFVR